MILREITKNKTGTGLLIENDGFVSLTEDKRESLIESLGDARGVDLKVPFPFIVPAVFQKYNVQNANNRIYPEKILRRQVDLYQRKIDDKTSTGELNHPSDSVIDGERTSHRVTKLYWEGATLLGELLLLVSPGYVKYGIISCVADKVANDMLYHDVKLGVSSRGLGSVQEVMNKFIVQDDFELICWDIVTDPSTPGAWMGKSSDELQVYVENKTKNGEIISKLDDLLII